MGFSSSQGYYTGAVVGETDVKKCYADMDPVEEILAIRVEMMREFKTLDALCDDIKKNPPMLSTKKNKAGIRSLPRRKSAKHLAHA